MSSEVVRVVIVTRHYHSTTRTAHCQCYNNIISNITVSCSIIYNYYVTSLYNIDLIHIDINV